MVYRPRIPTRFSNEGDTEDFDFPTAEFAFEIDQELHIGHAPLTGSHGALDLLGEGVAVKAPHIVRIGFRSLQDSPEEVDTEIDAMLDKCWRYGLGKLWTSGLESSVEVERWTRARLMAMPRVSWQAGEILTKGATVSFICPQAQWFGETALSGSPFTINSDPEDIVVNNTGNDRIYNAILTLTGTYTNPKIVNQTNGYTVESTRDGAAASDHLRFDAGRPAVEFSDDTGATWTGDYANFVRKAGQVQLMVLEPGNNTLRVTGCSSGSLILTAYPAYH